MDAFHIPVTTETESPTGQTVITVRLPREMHAALKDAAHARRMSLNQLCVATLSRVPLASVSDPMPVAVG